MISKYKLDSKRASPHGRVQLWIRVACNSIPRIKALSGRNIEQVLCREINASALDLRLLRQILGKSVSYVQVLAVQIRGTFKEPIRTPVLGILLAKHQSWYATSLVICRPYIQDILMPVCCRSSAGMHQGLVCIVIGFSSQLISEIHRDIEAISCKGCTDSTIPRGHGIPTKIVSSLIPVLRCLLACNISFAIQYIFIIECFTCFSIHSCILWHMPSIE